MTAATSWDSMRGFWARVDKYDLDQTTWAEDRATAFGAFRRNGLLWRQRLRHLLEAMAEPGDGYAEFKGNLLVTGGKDELTKLLIGSGGTPLANAHGIVGVGTSSTAATVADTALGADNTANAFYQGFDTSNPSQSGGTITGVSTFASGVAQFSWNEFCWAASSGTYGGTETSTQLIKTSGAGLWAAATTQIMWNHAIPAPSLGTKGAVAWILTSAASLQ